MRVLKENIYKFDLEFICLLGTKNKKEKVELVRRKLKFSEGFMVEPEGLSGGIALWWKGDWTVNILGNSRNVVESMVCNGDYGEVIRFFGFMEPLFLRIEELFGI